MSSVRPGVVGATRRCPHCRETILESAAVCPACKHYLRYEPGAGAAESTQESAQTPLRIEGSIRHPPDGEPGSTRSSSRSATIAARRSRASWSASAR